MPSARNVEAVAKAYAWLDVNDPLDRRRVGYDEMAPPAPDDVATETATVGGVPGQWFTPPDPTGVTTLFFHGGGYVIGSSKSHADLTGRIAKATGSRLFSVDYRRAPDDPFPAAYDDALAAYRGMLADGVDPQRFVVAGDSAGGALALAALVAARDAGEPLPVCAYSLSIWSDLSCSGESYAANVELDPFVTPEMGHTNAAEYLAGADARDPRASPVFADLSGLPPLLLQVGTDELLLDDTRRVTEKARAAGVEVTEQIAEGQMHVFQHLTWLLPEAQEAIEDIGAFVRRHAV